MIIILLAFITTVNSFGFLAAGTMFRRIHRRNAKKRIAREREENDRIARERAAQSFIEHDAMYVVQEYANCTTNN